MLQRSRIGVWPLFLTVLVAASSIACEKQPAWKEPGPKDVVDAFLMHWLRGEAELAFDYVLPADRELLTAGLKKLDDVPEDRRPEPHEMLVVASVANLYDIAKMELKQELEKAPDDGQQVVVLLHRQDGTTAEAELVWSEGRWFVDLPLEASETEG